MITKTLKNYQINTLSKLTQTHKKDTQEGKELWQRKDNLRSFIELFPVVEYILQLFSNVNEIFQMQYEFTYGPSAEKNLSAI